MRLLCSKQVPAQPASQQCLLVEDCYREPRGVHDTTAVLYSTVHWENVIYFSKTTVLYVAINGDRVLWLA